MEQASPQTAIEVIGLNKSYNAKQVLYDVSFSVKRGTVTGLLGPNGAGKSTIMNIITGYIKRDSGTVSVNGADPTEAPLEVKACMGYLPETPPVYDDMTVMEYMRFVFRLKKADGNKREHITNILKKLDLYNARDKLIGTLSKGYRQRTGIAQALIGSPDILILDEPTVGLDPVQLIEMRDIIRGLAASHTVILSTHILQEVNAVCSEVILINGGRVTLHTELSPSGHTSKRRLLVHGSKDSLAETLSGLNISFTPEHSSENTACAVIEMSDNAEASDRLFYALSEARLPIISLSDADPTLEEMFMRAAAGSPQDKEVHP